MWDIVSVLTFVPAVQRKVTGMSSKPSPTRTALRGEGCVYWGGGSASITAIRARRPSYLARVGVERSARPLKLLERRHHWEKFSKNLGVSR